MRIVRDDDTPSKFEFGPIKPENVVTQAENASTVQHAPSVKTEPSLMEQAHAPRLCYFGNLPVEASSAGPAQLYRVLHKYPEGRLQIFEVDCRPSAPELRIPKADYRRIMPLFERGWYFSRMKLPRLFWALLEFESWRQVRLVEKTLMDFHPEAVLSIHEGIGWYTAAKLARRLQVPLHLIMHDDWFRNIPMAPALKTKFEKVFGEIYRAASSRFCISPYMEEEYARRFNAVGTVLYPIRSPKAVQHVAPPSESDVNSQGLKVAYAGNLWHKGNWESLRNLAAALETIGGQLLIFGPTTADDARRHGLNQANVKVHGFVPDLIQSLRDEAHVVFVAMTFEESERRNMEVCFPSKMTEYTAAGLPVLIQGPEYSSAVRWARENQDAAEIVIQQGREPLERSLQRLLNPEWRGKLGRRALELGNQCFSFENGTRILRSTLIASHGRPIAWN